VLLLSNAGGAPSPSAQFQRRCRSTRRLWPAAASGIEGVFEHVRASFKPRPGTRAGRPRPTTYGKQVSRGSRGSSRVRGDLRTARLAISSSSRSSSPWPRSNPAQRQGPDGRHASTLALSTGARPKNAPARRHSRRRWPARRRIPGHRDGDRSPQGLYLAGSILSTTWLVIRRAGYSSLTTRRGASDCGAN